MKNKCMSFTALIVMIGCVGCSSEKAGLRELKKLCQKDAGLTIYKTVEADGFYNAYSNDGITEHLIKRNYGFYEFCDSEPSKLKDSMFPESGCFRVSKVLRETGFCDERVDSKLATFVVDPYPQFLKTHCIAVEKIDKPTARYSYHNGIKFWPAKNGVSEFGRTYVEIRERESGELLSEYISYSYNHKPRFSSPKSCRLLDKKFAISIKYDLIEKTIVPHKEK